MIVAAGIRSEPHGVSRRLAWQVPVAAALLTVGVSVGGGMRPELIGVVFLALVTAELCRIDVAERRLPNAIVLPGLGFAAIGVCWQAMLEARIPFLPLVSGLGFFVFLLVLNLCGGMGAGDVKLALLLGLAIGPFGGAVAFAGPIVAFTAGGVVGLWALFGQGLSRSADLPFGPFLLLGFWGAICAEPLIA